MSKDSYVLLAIGISYLVGFILALVNLLKTRNSKDYLSLEDLVDFFLVFIMSPVIVSAILPVTGLISVLNSYNGHKFFKKAKK